MSRVDLTTLEWTYVDRVQPVDLSNIRDKGMKGAAMLAVALGWNLIQRDGQPAQLVSREGIRRNLPTDTGVRQSVFWSVVASIISHSDGRLPTASLIDHIVDTTGMSKAHAQVLRSKCQIMGEGLIGPDPTLEDEDEPEPEPGFVPTERIEPTMATGTNGWGYQSPLMDTVVRQLVEDGDEQITYRCKICGLEFDTKRGVGGHYQVHIKAGEATATNQLRKKWVKLDVESEPEPVESEPEPVEPEPTPMTDEEWEPFVEAIESEPSEGYKAIVDAARALDATNHRDTRAWWKAIANLNAAVAAYGDDPDATTPVERTFSNNKPLVNELLELRRVVATIAELVGQDAIEQLQVKVDELTIERDAAVARAERLASDLRTLRELIGGLSSE